MLVKLLDTEGVHVRIKTAAASALANITDHDVRHCQVKKRESAALVLNSAVRRRC